MGIAGFSLGVAVAARPTCILGGIAFIPPLLYFKRSLPAANYWVRCIVSAASALGVCVCAVLFYNYARFGNVFEFGQNYQLSGVYESKMRHFDWRYIPHNFYLYYEHAGTWTSKFPFVEVKPVNGGPAGYLGDWSEAICGIAVTFPFIWLVLALPITWTQGKEEPRLRAIVSSIALYFIVMSLVVLSYFVATERYLADFAPSLVLLSACGWLGVERCAQSCGQRIIFAMLSFLLCLTTLLAAILVSFDYHGGLLHTLSPQVWEKIKIFCANYGW